MSEYTTASGPSARARGFTLIELMITLVVLAILGAIAFPIYQNQVREARRTDARTALLELAGREQRYFATNNAYTTSAQNLGYTGWGAQYPIDSGGYYYISAPTVNNSNTPPSFSLQAQPEPGSDQANDTSCKSFIVDSTGAETATGSGTNPSATCWGH